MKTPYSPSHEHQQIDRDPQFSTRLDPFVAIHLEIPISHSLCASSSAASSTNLLPLVMGSPAPDAVAGCRPDVPQNTTVLHLPTCRIR
jgi:hypothetical protein